MHTSVPASAPSSEEKAPPEMSLPFSWPVVARLDIPAAESAAGVEQLVWITKVIEHTLACCR